MKRRYFLFILSFACIAFVVPGAALASECVDGTITASLVTEGEHIGLYKYTIEISWNTPQGLSNVTLDCGFDECACESSWWFDDPAGTGSGGDPDSCDFEFSGEFNCQGNPSIGIDHPILKWDAIQTEDCEAGATGSATLCFYTAAAPAPASVPVILIKNGQNVCEGTIEGDCPFPCPVSIEEGTWSSLKALYR